MKCDGEEDVSVEQWLPCCVGHAELGDEVIGNPDVTVVVHDVHIDLHCSLDVHTKKIVVISVFLVVDGTVVIVVALVLTVVVGIFSVVVSFFVPCLWLVFRWCFVVVVVGCMFVCLFVC